MDWRGSQGRTGRGRMLLAVLILALAAGGCSKTRLEVESDTCWDGLINGTVHIGACGNKNYDVTSGFKCAELQKQTAVGLLRARIVDRTVWVETSEPFGLIKLCK